MFLTTPAWSQYNIKPLYKDANLYVTGLEVEYKNGSKWIKTIKFRKQEKHRVRIQFYNRNSSRYSVSTISLTMKLGPAIWLPGRTKINHSVKLLEDVVGGALGPKKEKWFIAGEFIWQGADLAVKKAPIELSTTHYLVNYISGARRASVVANQ